MPRGSRREPDVVAEIRSRTGEPALLLIHIEVQAEWGSDFPARMFEYYAMIWLRYRLPILPFAVYIQGGRGLTEEEYRVRLFGWEGLRFRYRCVGLAKLNAETYAEKNSAVGAALAALMDRSKVQEPLNLRGLLLERVGTSEHDEARKFLLTHIVEAYWQLTRQEAARFPQLLQREGFREAQKMEFAWADKLREEGHQKGRQEGRLEGLDEGLLKGKRDTLLRLMMAKFGPLSEELATRIQGLESLEELDQYLDRLVTASSLAEMQLSN